MSPDKRKHRGPGPKDYQLFAEDQITILKAAAKDYCWLLDRDYSAKAALKIVGDHFKLRERQRKALDRCCQPSGLVMGIKQRELILASGIIDQPIIIDGFNLLIILEAALSGAPLFKGRDSLIRDISGLHGSYHKISETPIAISLAAEFFKEFPPSHILWVFDKPVSNSGRLAALVAQTGKETTIKWHTKLENQTDNKVSQSDGVVISSDSQIVTKCGKWFNLSSYIIDKHMKEKWLIDIWKS